MHERGRIITKSFSTFVKSVFFVFLFLCVSVGYSVQAAPADIDPTFYESILNGVESSIETLSLQSDGKAIIGGMFTTFNDTAQGHIARINTDGSLDTTFVTGSGASSNVYVTAIQSDGKILIGGFFSNYNGVSRPGIARLNTDGSLDTTFNPGSGALGINAMKIQSDGKIIIGGGFTSYNGTSRNRIARINANGSLDTTFNPGTGVDSSVESIFIQPDGKILIGGDFTTYNGTARTDIARINTNGSLDTTFNPGTGTDYLVRAITVQSDGKIFIGGLFYAYNGTTRYSIARLNTNGSLDTTFDSTSAYGMVEQIHVQSDGKVLISGSFYGGMVRVNSDGSLDGSFSYGTGLMGGLNGPTINAFGIQSDGGIVIGGDYTSYNGFVRARIARIASNGTFDATYGAPNTGTEGSVRSVVTQSDGKIIIGGSFSFFNSVSRNRIARLNTDGALDTSFDPGTGANNAIYATAVQNDGKILIGGGFSSYNGTTRNRIARLNSNGTLDASFNPGTGLDAFNSDARSFSIQSDGRILVGGRFTTYNGTSRNRIARINTDGSLDTTFNPGTGADNTVHDTIVQSDGKIVIGGEFTTYNGTSRNRIVRINTDGSLDTTFNPGTGANNIIYAIAIQSDGKILIGGEFTTYNGTSRNRIARINTDGSLDTTFNPGTGVTPYPISSMVLQSDGKILIGGQFTSYNGTARRYISRINTNGGLDATFVPSIGANNFIHTIFLQSDEKILIGGDFTLYNGQNAAFLTRLEGGTMVLSPTLSTQASTNIGATTATGNGNITDTGGENPTRGIQWGTTSGMYTHSCNAGTGGTGVYSCAMTSLTPLTTYYVRAYATNSGGTGYGTEMSFTTKSAADFVITVKTDNPGTSSSTQFTIPTNGSGYNYNVDCNNDGTNEVTGATGNYTCNYASAGTYTVRIKDNTGLKTGFRWIYFNNVGDRLKILSVEQWGTGLWFSMNAAFSGCENLVINATDAPNLTGVSGMYAMFQNATSVNQDIGTWNTTAVTDMSWMFAGATSFNQDIGAWNTSNVISTAGMFQNATAFNQDLSAWNTGNVTNMSLMFSGASSFDQNIGAWDTNSVTGMYAMFQNATAFNQDLSMWNTNSVTDISWMFAGATSFDHDLSSWDTADVVSTVGMFSNATSFNQNLGTWNVGNVTNMTDMFTNSALSSTNYDSILIGWNNLPSLQNNVTLHSPAIYCAGATARSNIIATHTWTINDAGLNCPVNLPTVTTQSPTNITHDAATGNGTITNTGGEDPERFIEWGTTSGTYANSCSAGKGTTGTYTCIMSLIPNTTYYVRAKATNSAGTSYGSETSLTTNNASDIPRQINIQGITEFKGNVKIK